ncbi:nucleoside deaminase [Candidatus Magnetaquiglobus chichijimensis]|uniref:nucleoside deaminase n=1 Tax=Candidatus Magnetaquiglobus chichijimensis TaxID=3141448 RepID=UPI003B97B16E
MSPEVPSDGTPPPEGAWLSEGRARALLALVVAAEAGAGGEVPVGALLTDAMGRPLAARGNDCVTAADPLGHAELRTLRLAARRVGNYRLGDTALHVSLEPCPICRAALAEARVARVTHDAPRLENEGDRRGDAVTHDAPRLENEGDRRGDAVTHDAPHVPIEGQEVVCAADSAGLLRFFFRERRIALNLDGESALILDSMTSAER